MCYHSLYDTFTLRKMMKTAIEKLENRDLVRHNKLVNGKVKLKAKSYDLIRSISTLVDYSDTDFHTYQLKVSDLGIDYKRAKECIRDIMRNPIEIKDDIKKTFECYAWCSYLTYEDGYITFELHKKMKEFMIQLKGNFTKTFEQYIMPMSSIYAKRIYEMLKQNEDYGYRKFNLEELQEILNVPRSMKTYPNFKKKVLLIAIKEINKYTDIYIPVDTENLKDSSWIKLQCGVSRKITHLNFEFTMKDQTQKVPAEITDPQETPQSEQTYQLDMHAFKELSKNIEHLDLEVEFGLTREGNENLMELFYFYLQEQIIVFMNYCKENKKNYTNITTSFKRHIRGAYHNRIDFFADPAFG